MKVARILIAAAIVLAIAACSSVRVQSDFDDRASFQTLRTYGWVESGAHGGVDPAVSSPLVHRRIRNAIDSQLIARGYRFQADSPDFLVSFNVLTRNRTDITTTGCGYYGGYAHRYGLGGDIRTDHYVESTLVVDVLDVDSGEVVWRGWALGDLDAEPSPDKVNRFVENAVGKILKEFPPER